MSLNLNRISQLVRVVDVLVEMKNYKNDMTSEKVEELLKSARVMTEVEFSKEEIEAARRDITYKYQIYSTPGQSIVMDYDEEKWYDDIKENLNSYFWTRYKNYLIDTKKFSPNIVSTLGEETLDQKLMNYLGNPNSSVSFFRRGLIIGDVQSGKTSTYIGLICKAADAGYKVFILLTGTIESLRKQTQERVEEGFTGINISAETNQRVGVGLDNKPIQAMTLTSRLNDFTGNVDQIAVSLASKDAVIFIIKKNSTVLENLTDWLKRNNANPITKKIDLPMLLIDDEADNASINTSKNKENPTKINRMIRELATVFTKSNYVGFTATPFANVFIDPETTEEMENEDLFPENFIVSLPTPSNYIGPSQIFSKNGKYHSQLIFIKDAGIEEDDGWPFYFKHKKEWDDFLPNSLTDAVYTFYIANAIRDLRGDKKAHRSMLINMSRFVKVQHKIKEQIEQLHSRAYRAIKFNLSADFDESLKDPIIRRLYKNYKEQYSNTEFKWEDVANVLYNSIENIQIKVVNSSKSSEKLEYPENESLRVIAIGGLALSRGLTLEGLIVSYFYRNTCTYDVLMQMGRWFGYRKNYEDLFRIWTSEDSADWYEEIAEASEMLKSDMETMREQKLKPKNFGIRVRNNSNELRITAPNKMRNVTDEFEFDSYFGTIVETPYVIFDPKIQIDNFNFIKEFMDELVKKGLTFDLTSVKGIGKHHVMSNVDKSDVVSVLRKLKTSNLNPNFNISQIVSFITSCETDELDLWDIAFMDGNKSDKKEDIVEIGGKNIYKLKRLKCDFGTKNDKKLSLGKNGRLGGPNDGLLGIENYNNKTADDIISEAKEAYKHDYEASGSGNFTGNYKSETWFKYVSDRKPLILVYLIDVDSDEIQQKKKDEFKENMNGVPVVGLAIGFPKTTNIHSNKKNRYKANRVYNWFAKQEILAEGDEEE